MAASRGTFELLLGCMYSGKTGRLLTEGHRHELAGRRVLYVTSAHDSGRYTDGGAEIVTHLVRGVQARVPAVAVPRGATLVSTLCTQRPDEMVLSLRDAHAGTEVVLVDECQFVDGMPEAVHVLCDELGLHVVAATLQATFAREPWPALGVLVALADHVHHLRAVCRHCGGQRPAAHSARLLASSGAAVQVGGAESYEARCRQCWTPAPE